MAIFENTLDNSSILNKLVLSLADYGAVQMRKMETRIIKCL